MYLKILIKFFLLLIFSYLDELKDKNKEIKNSHKEKNELKETKFFKFYNLHAASILIEIFEIKLTK